MKAKQLDKRFDEGKDISQYLDMSKAKRSGQEHKRVNVDFPLMDDSVFRQRGQTAWGASAIRD